MITVITFNPSIDRLYKLDKFEVGSVQRSNFVNPTAGGKGLNVSKVLKKLNQNVNCIGFLGGFNGEYIKSELSRVGIESKFTSIEGESRICLNIIDNQGVSTEVLENGPEIKENEIAEFEKKLESILEETSILVASGSLAKGLPKDYYLKIGNLCREKNIKFILDASGESLKLALESRPYLIKPNQDELGALTNIKISNIDDAIIAAKNMLDTGVENVCVSMGKYGMILVNKKELYIVNIPKIDVVNTVGSGDSCIAGFALGTLKGYDIEKTLKLSNACGMSNAMHLDTGNIDIQHINKFIEEIKVEEYICKNESQI